MAVMPRPACAVNSTYLNQASNHDTPAESRCDTVVAMVAERYRLSLCIARLVCHLPEIGARPA
jgi:hypothetical protein